MYYVDELNSLVSFSGGGGGGGGGNGIGGTNVSRSMGTDRSNRGRNERSVDNGYGRGRASVGDFMTGISEAAGPMMDGILGQPGDNPDMGAMSDAARGNNSGGGFRGGGGRGGGSGR